MIPVQPVPKPADFEARCETPGNSWRVANPSRSPRDHDLWSPFRGLLKQGFGSRCGYCGIHVSGKGTVDHFLSIHNHPGSAYIWENYRFSSDDMNRKKRTLDDQVLDPYEVGEGWFDIDLQDLRMVVTNKVPVHLRAKAEFTLKRLGLEDDEDVVREREGWKTRFEALASQANWAALDIVRDLYPLMAEAVERKFGRAQ